MDRLEPHRRKVIEAIEPVDAERMLTHQASGRFLAAAAAATRSSPPHACSAMDGYAVRHGDVGSTTELRVREVRYAGDLPGSSLAPGEAVRIFTGAPLPPGADTVVREESVEVRGGFVRIRHGVARGENVRQAGEDVVAGAEALPAGTRVGARQLALLEAVGCGEVVVRRIARVAVIATGDEIVRGRIPDSNGAAVAGLVEEAGLEARRSAVGDEAGALRDALAAAASTCDAVVTLGGVSIGEKDLVAGVLGALGAEIRVHGVPMKPGKPFLFARLSGRPVLGLPGSPSACLVAFEVFARPALLALAGAARVDRARAFLPLAAPCEGRPGRARFVWAAIDGDGRVRPLGRDAAQVRGPALAQALVRIPEGSGDVAEGERVETWLLDG